MKNTITIRDGEPKDVGNLFELIKELAEYEQAPTELINTPENLLNDAFGPNKAFGFIVAENNDIEKIVGTSVYYIRYSTWKGRVLYLEDLIVSSEFRRQGIGGMLMQATRKKADELNCKRITWQVLDWNQPAIDFYKNYTQNFDGGWVNVHWDCL